MKEEIKNRKTLTVHQRFLSIYKKISSYCLKCWKNTESKNAAKTNKEEPMFLSKSAVCDSKKLRFTKEQEAEGLLSMVAKIQILSSLSIKCKVKIVVILILYPNIYSGHGWI